MKDDDALLLDWVETIAGSEVGSVLRSAATENPGRISRAYQELLGVGQTDSVMLLKVTKELDGTEDAGELTIDELRFASMCPHHFLPYFGTGTLTYKPKKRIMGLGKIPRFVESHARGFWLQEELTVDLVNVFARAAEPEYISIELTSVHLCICSRGPRSFGETITRHVWSDQP